MKIELITQTTDLALSDPTRCLQASATWASRELSISNGTSGLLLARDPQLKAFQVTFRPETCVFSSVIESVDLKAEIFETVNTFDKREVIPIGDVFTGLSALTWSNFVFARTTATYKFSDQEGSVSRPGLAHGDLIRSFTKANQNNSLRDWSAPADNMHGLGWCNGQAGQMAAMAIVARLYGDTTKRNNLKSLADSVLRELEDSSPTMEYGLCHGVAGVYVTLIGACRAIGARDLADDVKRSFMEWFRDVDLTKLPPNIFLDLSWLTGLAGLQWAFDVLNNPPLFNPLLPTDSTLWAW